MTWFSINIFRATGTRLDPSVCALIGRLGTVAGQVSLMILTTDHMSLVTSAALRAGQPPLQPEVSLEPQLRPRVPGLARPRPHCPLWSGGGRAVLSPGADIRGDGDLAPGPPGLPASPAGPGVKSQLPGEHHQQGHLQQYQQQSYSRWRSPPTPGSTATSCSPWS